MTTDPEPVPALRLLDFLLFDPDSRMLRIRRRETAHGTTGAPPAAFPDGRTEAPFCACVYIERPQHYPTLAKEALGALLNADLLHFADRVDGYIAFELVQTQRIGLKRSKDASLTLIGEGGLPTAPQPQDVFAFHPKERKICFFRDNRRLHFLEGSATRPVFPDPILNDGSLALVLQEAAHALLGLVASPILDEPAAALAEWKRFRLRSPADPGPALHPSISGRPASTPPVRTKRPAGRR